MIVKMVFYSGHTGLLSNSIHLDVSSHPDPSATQKQLYLILYNPAAVNPRCRPARVRGGDFLKNTVDTSRCEGRSFFKVSPFKTS